MSIQWQVIEKVSIWSWNREIESIKSISNWITWYRKFSCRFIYISKFARSSLLEKFTFFIAYTGCPVDFDPPKNGDQIANFASNGLPLKTIAFLILRKLGILKFLKNLENCRFFYFGEKWWSKFILIQFGSINGLPPPDI